jgi:hypothetical protein
VKRLSLLLLWACGPKVLDCPPQSPAAKALTPIETRCEVHVEAENPFELEVWGDLELPDGGVASVPAFLGRDFTRALSDAGVEQLTPAGEASWRVRFAAPAPGRYRWRWRYEDQTTPWQSLDVGAALGHGFLRRSPEDPTRLNFDDGTPYVALGENVAWADARGTYAYDDWLGKLAAQRSTYARVWMAAWGFGLEWDHLGRYRLDHAWALDQVLDTARADGLSVMLTMQEHGAFSTTWNSIWQENPYNAANGGPLERPGQLFDDEKARRLFKQRLRYIVGRWSAYPQLLAWELFNEVDLTDSEDPARLAAWHVEMAEYLRSMDPNHHLVTTSLAGRDDSLFELPALDLAQLHLYGNVGSLPERVKQLERFGKPVLAAEVGVSAASGDDTLALDPSSYGFHDSLWSGLLSGSIGTGMSWWWDSVVEPKNLYPHLAPAAQLVDGVRLERLKACAAEASPPLQVLALCGPQGLAWIKGRSAPHATVTLTGLKDGAYRVQWIDPYGGPGPEGGTATASGGRLTVSLPDFRRDLALRVMP